MVKISRINTAVFILMFVLFLFSSKFLLFLGIKISGIEYILWFLFACLLAVINFKYLRKAIILKQTYFLLLLILLLFCLINYFFIDAPLMVYMQGTFFTFLFAANFILFYNIKIEKKDLYFIIDSVIFIVAFIAVMAYLERIFVSRDYFQYVLRGVQTVAKDPSFLATFLNISLIMCFSMRMITKRKKYLYFAIFFFVTIIMLLFVKAIITSLIICVAFIYIYFHERFRRAYLMVFGTLLLFLSAILGPPVFKSMEYRYNLYFGEHAETIPRNVMYITGYKIAKDYFPFGCGQGTFGSYPVGKSYSPVYYQYGLDKVQGLGPKAGRSKKENFLFDTHWPHILGEMGFIATFFYLWLWFFPAIKTFPFILSWKLEIKALSFFITMVMTTIFIESIAAPLPDQLQFILIYAGLGAIAYKLLFKEVQVQREN